MFCSPSPPLFLRPDFREEEEMQFPSFSLPWHPHSNRKTILQNGWIIYQNIFIFLNSDTICHRKITEGFKTVLAQVFLLREFFWKQWVQHKSNNSRAKRALLKPPNVTDEDETRETLTPLKVTSLRVSAKVSRITTTVNAHHKITNATQDYEFHTMKV